MPSMTAYSSYETLTLFQSIAKYGTDASTFQDISSALTKSEFNLPDEQHDVDRLSAKALRGLYDEVVKHEKIHDAVKVNGDVHSGERSPKRRKLSASPQSSLNNEQDEQDLVHELVDRLYARYKDEAIKEIRREEGIYARLQDEIESLEIKVKALRSEDEASSAAISGRTERPTAESSEAKPNDSRSGSGGGKSSASEVNGASTDSTVKIPVMVPDQMVSVANTLDQPRGQPAAGTPQSKAEGTKPSLGVDAVRSDQVSRPRNQAQQSQNDPNNTAPTQTPLSKNNVNSQTSSVQAQRQPAPLSTAIPVPNTHHRPPLRQDNPPGHVSPAPPQSHQYSPYSQHHNQWHPQMAHPHYAQYPVYSHGPPPYYAQSMQGRHPQTPQQSPYHHYPHTAPMQYGQPHGWHGQPYAPYPASSATTPVSRPDSRVSVTRSGSTTPWRKKRDVGIQRQSSPKRPERAISPLEPDASPPPTAAMHNSKTDDSRQGKRREEENTPTQLTRVSRRGRPPSKTPSAMAVSRSESIASRNSDTVHEKTIQSRRADRIKIEPPSTPLPPPSDSDTQKSSGRRGRPRKNTLVEPNRQPATKRKRESVSPSPSVQSPIVAHDSVKDGNLHLSSISHDPSLVIVSKNFSKTSQLLLNEITSHKLAGIFAKPLSERDAPGYKDLIHRTQDLKSVKAAISKGSRAALAAIEALESDEQLDTTPLRVGHTGNTPAAIGNGFYLVAKTSDLVPPKGIVNGAQLEMELTRMFANAIMFNPLPSSERGFGRHLKLRKNGGDVDPKRHRIPDSQDDTSDDDQASEESDTTMVGGAGWDEGGIIADTREMFDDVGEAVNKWRVLEVERMATSGPNIESSRTGSVATPNAAGTHLDVISGRHASLSASSNIGDDEGDGGSTPVPSSIAGTTRKRRRIAEH